MPTPAMIWFNITPTPWYQKVNRENEGDISKQGSAMGWYETGIPDRDLFSGISVIWDGMSFRKTRWDRNAPLYPGHPGIIPEIDFLQTIFFTLNRFKDWCTFRKYTFGIFVFSSINNLLLRIVSSKKVKNETFENFILQLPLTLRLILLVKHSPLAPNLSNKVQCNSCKSVLYFLTTTF